MPSPFPGMDPYLEAPAIWEDFHQNLASEIQRQLAPGLSPKYIAALVPHISYEEVLVGAGRVQAVKPDVGIFKVQEAAVAYATAVITSAPITAPAVQELPVRLFTVEIREVATGEWVTAVEILSPVNKRRGHKAYRDYRRKRRDLARNGIHLLEIDLLRQGERWPVQIALPDEPYFIFLQRSGASHIEIWPIPLLQPIPIVPVPLLDPDPDVPLDLNQAIPKVYDQAYYHLRLNYAAPPPKPDLLPDVQQAVDVLLAQAGYERER